MMLMIMMSIPRATIRAITRHNKGATFCAHHPHSHAAGCPPHSCATSNQSQRHPEEQDEDGNARQPRKFSNSLFNSISFSSKTWQPVIRSVQNWLSCLLDRGSMFACLSILIHRIRKLPPMQSSPSDHQYYCQHHLFMANSNSEYKDHTNSILCQAKIILRIFHYLFTGKQIVKGSHTSCVSPHPDSPEPPSPSHHHCHINNTILFAIVIITIIFILIILIIFIVMWVCPCQVRSVPPASQKQ